MVSPLTIDACLQGDATFADLVEMEVSLAKAQYPPMNSAHEGYDVLLEEVDELWDEVKKKQGKRDPANLLKELVQVAAMAERMAEDIVLRGNAQK